MKQCNGICLTGNDLGVPECVGVVYPHPECELHNPDEELCYHGYSQRGSGCYICEAANE